MKKVYRKNNARYITRVKEISNKIVFAAKEIIMFLFFTNAAEKTLQISKTNGDKIKPTPGPQDTAP